ncbi:MAG: hypothetical protein GX230_03130 [Lentisphaerae bacterium]|nr:hypothetical protein [Lentisphaerota bacterium]
MRKLLLLAIVISLGCNAQELGLLVDTESRTYLIGEPIEVSTRIHNRTTRTFTPRRGNEAAHLSITVMRGESRSHVEPHGRELHLADIDLPSSEVWQGQVEITRLFNLRNEGRYLIRLIAVHDGMRYESFPRTVEIVAGFEITKVEQVFPGNPPHQRELRLSYWIRNQMEELFLQVTEKPETRQWRTYSLGPLIRTTAPKIDIAPDGLLTIVHRATPDVFIKSEIRSDDNEVAFLGQERLVDPVASSSKRMAPFQAMAVEDAIKKRDEKKKRSWWPF